MNSPWIQLLEDRILNKADKIPKDFLTAKDLMKIWKLTYYQVNRRLREFIKDGKVERRIFTIGGSNGKLNHAPHYRVMTKGKV